MPRLKDRTNIRYGKLIAKQYLGNSKWLCQCDCGNTVIVYGGHLEDGHTQSCGCSHKPKIDLTNQRFGNLVVKQWVGKGKWQCQCDCGNIIEVKTGNLTSKNTQSCGCLQKKKASEMCFIDLTHQRFGKLTVVKRIENGKYGVKYLCKCDCGGEASVYAANLRSGNTNSCGCIKSKGEMIINNWLQKNNFQFQSQYSFDNCFLSTGRRPFFDFVLFKHNKPYFIIEYNGLQHYKITGGWNDKENFEQTQRRDREKLQWCQENNYPILIIKYDDDIEAILNKILINNEDILSEL